MKTNRLFSTVITLVMLLTILLTGCTPAGLNSDGNDDRTRLYISVFKAGEGTDWLEAIAAEYEKQRPDVKVVIKGDANMEGTAQAALESGNADAVSDIFSCISDGNFLNNVVNDRLEPLDDLYEMTVEGTEKVKDIVDPDAAISMKVNGSYYAMPWFRQASGIIYNVKMFEQYGWKVPTTMNEYYALCDQICRESDVYPFTFYTGSGSGYMLGFFENLMFQYGGKTAAQEFYAAASPEVYKQEGRTEAYKAVAKMITGEGVDRNGKVKTWVQPGSYGRSHLEVQQEFIKGNCAMVLSGSWLMTEMSEFLEEFPNFEAAMMHTPWIQDSKTSLDGGTQCANMTKPTRLVIPTIAKNKEIAKDFLCFMNTAEMRKLFVEKTHGMPRPTSYDGIDISGLDTFGRSVLDVITNDFYYNGEGRNAMFNRGDLSVMLAADGSIINEFKNSINLSDVAIQNIAIELVENDYNIATEKFDLLG